MSPNHTEHYPRATREDAERYEFLTAETHRLLKSGLDDIVDALVRIEQGRDALILDHDWKDEVFEVDGKKGLKDVKGRIVVPALYDGFTHRGHYIFQSSIVVAQQGDKVGIVARDGSGAPLSAFAHAEIVPIAPGLNFSDAQLVRQEANGPFALLVDGEVFTPYEITGCFTPSNGYLVVQAANGKCGMLDLVRRRYVTPEYDEIRDEGDGTFITFVKDGKEGLLTLEGRFVSEDEYARMTDDEQDALLEAGLFSVEI